MEAPERPNAMSAEGKPRHPTAALLKAESPGVGRHPTTHAAPAGSGDAREFVLEPR